MLLSRHVLYPFHVLGRLFEETLFFNQPALGNFIIERLELTRANPAAVDALIFLEGGQFLALLKCGFFDRHFDFFVE